MPPAARTPSGSRCWTLHGPGGALDVEVVARDDVQLSEVADELRRSLDLPSGGLWDGSARLPDDLRLDDPRLAHGAVLGAGRPAPRERSPAADGALEVAVVGGRDAGRALALQRGRHVVGRGTSSVLPLSDPDVSRLHLEISVSAGGVAVADLGSSNGTALDGREVTGTAVPWPTGGRVHLGSTTLALGRLRHPPAVVGGTVAGRARLRTPVRLAEPRADLEVALPAPPSPPSTRRLAWLAVALPAVGGGVLAWVLATPTFLFFALLSPVVALASWWSDRRWGRRTHRREVRDHEALLQAAETRLADAVEADVRAAARRYPDLATIAGAAGRRSTLLWSRAASDVDTLTVRLGDGPGTTTVVRREPDGTRRPEPAARMPVTVDLRTGGLALVGPRDRTAGLVRAVVAQLASLHPPDSVELALVTSTPRLPDWRWTRWLPHLSPEAVSTTPEDPLRGIASVVERRRTARARGSGTDPWPGPWLIVVVDGTVPADSAATLASAGDVGIAVVTVTESVGAIPLPVRSVLEVAGETGSRGSLRTAGLPTRDQVVLDGLPLDVADRVARDLAGLTPARTQSRMPVEVPLFDLVPGAERVDDGHLATAWSRSRQSLRVPLGVGADGVEHVDLCRVGPHALVAGTTGAGKSELLRTWITGLALTHPPDRCSFLLVDYKGGAAFGEAAALPHTVGLVTDLDASSTARALRSLTAELVRRERLLADRGVSDIGALHEDVDLARLVIVVDEFASLAEELPAFVPGLIGIAQRGRSLGVHLVLATQRPAGVVSPEIRANCTLRICLRTADDSDSRDVLGGPEAAHLPLDVPGRAYSRAGGGPPRLLQVAHVTAAAPEADGSGPVVRPWTWPAVAAPAPSNATASTGLDRAVRLLRERAADLAVPSPHRPWRPPLPDRLTVGDLGPASGRDAAGAPILLGLVDRPDQQTQVPLSLDLEEAGGWLAVGGPRSGRTSLLRSVLRQAVTRCGADQVHVHVLDLAGGGLAQEAAGFPQVGTTIGTEDALRTVRLVQRLGAEVARRRAAGPDGSPSLLLLVDGVEAVCALLDDADPGRGSGDLLRLVRQGGAAGLTCVMTADRAVPGGRLAAAVRQRLVLPLPDRADYAVAGIAPSAVPSERPPGRALVGEDADSCQLALPPPAPSPAAQVGPAPAPLRVVDLPADPVLATRGDAARLRLPLGPGGDEGAALAVDLARSGGLLVVGPPGSGRTTTLDALAAELLAAGVPVLRVDPAASTDERRVTAWLDQVAGGPAVVWADDVGAPGEWPALAALPTVGSGAGVALLAAGSAGQLSTWFQGPVGALRRTRTGLLLTPGPGDADVLGTRLPRTPVPVRPGSGWLVEAGVPTRVQVARHRPRSGPAAQSSSSSGPISCVAYQASS